MVSEECGVLAGCVQRRWRRFGFETLTRALKSIQWEMSSGETHAVHTPTCPVPSHRPTRKRAPTLRRTKHTAQMTYWFAGTVAQGPGFLQDTPFVQSAPASVPGRNSEGGKLSRPKEERKPYLVELDLSP